MGATQARKTCPACGNPSPSHGHLKRHQRHDELVQRMELVGKQWVMIWRTPEQAKKAQAASC